jgi:hypothetical protein
MLPMLQSKIHCSANKKAKPDSVWLYPALSDRAETQGLSGIRTGMQATTVT